MKPLSIFILGICVLSACGKGKGKGGDGGSAASNIAILLTSQSRGIHSMASTSCEVRDNDASGAPSSDESGYCFTPTNIIGSIGGMQLGSTGGGDGGVRLLGGSETVHGLDAVFDFHKFDLLNATPFDGSDNIQDGSGSTLNMAGLSFYHLESVFAAAGETWHVRYFFYNSQPSLVSPFLGCAVGDSELAVLDEKVATLVPGVAFKKYDVMACLEATGETCGDDTDFKWIDKDDADYSLVATRPTNPLQLVNGSGGAPTTIFGRDDACSMGSEHPEYEFPSMEMYFDLSTSLTGLSAAIDAGKKTYTYGGKTGEKLTATIAFELSDFLFYPSSAGLGNDLQVSTLDTYKKLVRQNLNKILPKGLYVKTRMASRNTTYAFQHDVGVSLAVE